MRRLKITEKNIRKNDILAGKTRASEGALFYMTGICSAADRKRGSHVIILASVRENRYNKDGILCPEGGIKVFCQIIVDIVHENVAKPFTYRIPDGMKLVPGQRVAVPFGPREKEGIVLSLEETAVFDPSKVRQVLRPLEDYPAVLPQLMELAREMSDAVHCPLAETLRLMLPAQMRGGRIRVKTVPVVTLAVPPDKAEEALEKPVRSEKRKQILRMLLEHDPLTVKEIQENVHEPRETLKKLSGDGLIRIIHEETLRTPDGSYNGVNQIPPVLTPEQREVLDEILPAMDGKGGAFLLYGVTGSGKTEVFMSAVQHALEQGKGAIILVPEIALTPQMISWFRSRFGASAAVIHSRLSAGERFDEWRRIRRGDARVVIGARSAVFSPVTDLGLIVVDEEHETTYLNDHSPRYDAREIALSRCRREGASLVLASATPSVLSFAKARRGDYMLLEMPRRVHDRPLPEVDIVDMREELENGNRTVLSMEMKRALRDCTARGEQAMLLMNHRGYNSFVSCRACGYVVKCPNCDISMTYHMISDDGKLRCHYCGYEQAPPRTCPSCGSRYIRYFGAGTQKVEEEVRKLLPGIATARMDIDTTGGKDGHGKILEAFRSGRARILIGTQMIAKGLDFPKVTLVGVIAADLSLNLPDYRSRERTFQLLTQVAGRAGRGDKPGRVIIQTYKPEDPVIGYASRQDYRAFFEDEFSRRRTGLYPPFTVMARLLAESVSEDCAVRTAETLEERVNGLLAERADWKRKVLLMIKDVPPVKVLRGKYRRHILMKMLVGKETEALCGALTAIAADPFENTEVWFEYNPTTMI